MLINRNGGSALDTPKSMDRGTNTEITDALNIERSSFVLSGTFLTVLDWNLGEPDTNSTDIASQNVSSIQGLSSSDSIVKTLKIDWGKISGR